MEEATKNTLTKVFNWFAYVLAPFTLLGIAYHETPISAIIDNDDWFLIYLFLAGVCNGLMDIVKDKFDESVFKNFNRKFWDGKTSDRNKYVLGDSTRGRKKFFFNLIPIPVVFTDAWHFFKGFMTLFIVLAIKTQVNITNNDMFDFLIIWMVYKWGFNLVYKIISPKR